MALRTVDLFCGGGGSSWGAKAAGAEIVCGVDAWELAAKVYSCNFGEGTSVNGRLTAQSTAADLGDIGAIDLLLASPECTNHTCARGRRPQDEESKKTANHVVQIAEGLMPRWLVIENVIQMQKWTGYQAFLNNLGKLGYHLRTQVLNATDFGVPQSRRRLFITGDLESEPEIVKPVFTELNDAFSVLDPPGTWASRPLLLPTRAKPTLDRACSAIAELGTGKPFLIVYYGSDGSGGWQPLDRPLRTLTTLDRFGLVTWEGKTPMLRMLQVPELARAMGYDAHYKLLGTRREKIKLLGNGVAPPVMRAIVETLTGQKASKLNGSSEVQQGQWRAA